MNYKQKIDELIQEIKRQGYQNICFFHPVYAITGAVICRVQMIKYLLKNTDLNIYYYDFPDGYLHECLKDEDNLNFIPFQKDTTVFPLLEKCVIFAGSTRVILLKNMNPENKVIFWHNETVPCAWSSLLINKESKKFFRLIEKERGMMYHDWSSKDSLNRYNDAKLTNNDYYYITLPKKTKEASLSLLSNNQLNVAFLSRLSSDKINSLFYLANSLANISLEKPIRLHVIGDGLCKKLVENELEQYKDKLEIIYTGTIAHEDLDDYLIKNIDLLFGVGTCVVEAAALKMPAAALIMDNKKIEDNDAYWYFNTKDYCTGITTEQKKDFNIQYNTIEEIVKAMLEPDAKRNLGQKCYEYFIENHGNYEGLVVNFLNQITSTTLTFKKIKKCIKYTPYSLHTTERIKVLGIPIFKKITFAQKTNFYILGIRVLKKVFSENKVKYYFLGIKYTTKYIKSPYKFPNSMRKELAHDKKDE